LLVNWLLDTELRSAVSSQFWLILSPLLKCRGACLLKRVLLKSREQDFVKLSSGGPGMDVRVGTFNELVPEDQVTGRIVLVDGSEKGKLDPLIAEDVVADVDEPCHLRELVSSC
jgi:hypothetical protein